MGPRVPLGLLGLLRLRPERLAAPEGLAEMVVPRRLALSLPRPAGSAAVAAAAGKHICCIFSITTPAAAVAVAAAARDSSRDYLLRPKSRIFLLPVRPGVHILTDMDRAGPEPETVSANIPQLGEFP